MCPTCRIALMSADAGAPAFAAGGVAQAGEQPSSGQPAGPVSATPGSAVSPAGANWLKYLSFGGTIAVIVIIVAVFASLNIGGPATASDGSFSVQPPAGWHPTTFSFVDGKRVVLALAKQQNGVKAEFAVADFGQLVPLSAISGAWEQVVSAGQLQNMGRLGNLGSTTIGGAPALIVDVNGSQYSGQLAFLDYGNTTYILALVTPPGQFEQMRRTDFNQILSTWKWLH
jgi:hypothetical protein